MHHRPNQPGPLQFTNPAYKLKVSTVVKKRQTFRQMTDRESSLFLIQETLELIGNPHLKELWDSVIVEGCAISLDTFKIQESPFWSINGEQYLIKRYLPIISNKIF